MRLFPGQVHIESEQRDHGDDRHVVRGRKDFPELLPVHGYFFASFISESSTTAAGPEMPPSFRTRQKCRTMKMEAMMGMPMQFQMKERRRALASTMEPPSNPKRTSLYGVMPNIEPKGPSCPRRGVARAMFVPTVTAQKPS